jgi:hypothetical protein
MLPTAGNTPHDVLAVLRAHANGAAGEDRLLAAILTDLGRPVLVRTPRTSAPE